MKHEDRLSEIIQATRDLMIRAGGTSLSVRAVAKSIGIKLASLQYHVPNKEALLQLVLEDAIERYTAELKVLQVKDAQSPVQAFEDAVRWFVTQDEAWDEITAFELQLWSLAETDRQAREALDRYLAIYIDFLTSLIAQARPDLTQEGHRTRAISVASLIEGSTVIGRCAESILGEEGVSEGLVRGALVLLKS